jgi:predicted DNA-binding protein
MKESKKSVSFRLSTATLEELAYLAKQHQVSQAQVLAVLVHLVYIGGDMDSLEDWFDVAKMS